MCLTGPRRKLRISLSIAFLNSDKKNNRGHDCMDAGGRVMQEQLPRPDLLTAIEYKHRVFTF